MLKKSVAVFLIVSLFFTFSACASNDSDYYTADDGTEYMVYRNSDGNIVINDSGKLLVYSLNENNKRIKADSGEYITEYVSFNGQVVSGGVVETAELRFNLPNNFVESRENPGYFYYDAYDGAIFVDYYASGIDLHIQSLEDNCEDLLEGFGSEVFSYEKYTVTINGIECTAFSQLSITSEYYKNAFFYFIPYDTGYYVINCNVNTDYRNKVDFDSFAESIELKEY